MHVVIIGASIAGLAHARAFLPHAARITVLDHDELPTEARVRKGVGQGGQVHILLEAGRRCLEELFPGFFDELVAEGAIAANLGRELRWHHAGAFRVECDLPYTSYLQSRSLLEHHLRRRLARSGRVMIRDRTRVIGIDAKGGRVTGVCVAPTTGAGPILSLSADVVVDASGRGSRINRFLQEMGYAPPREESLEVGLGYATQLVRPKAQLPTEAHAYITYGKKPLHTRHGLAVRAEDGQWRVTLMGYHGDHAPTDLEGFVDYARTLAHPQIAMLLERSEPVGRIRVFRTPYQYRRHFHRIPLPEGLAVVGDAACGLDPFYGQGMSVACLQASALSRLLEKGPFDTRAAARSVFRQSEAAWLITSIEAYRYPQAGRGPVGIGIAHGFLDRVFDASAHDAEVYTAMLRVMQLEGSPLSLARPSVLGRLFGSGRMQTAASQAQATLA